MIPYSSPEELTAGEFELGSTSKEAISKSVQKAAQHAEVYTLAGMYLDTINNLLVNGWRPPSGVTPPTTLQQAVQDVEGGTNSLQGWTAPPPSPGQTSTPTPSPPSIPWEPYSFSIPWWVYAIIAIIVIAIIVALVR